MSDEPPPPPRLASLRTRLLAMVYEAVLVIALLFVATAIFVAVFGDSRSGPLQLALRAYLVVVAGAYFVWGWTGGRRTLAMRTWRIRILDRTGKPPSLELATVRYLVALAGLCLGAIGLVWSAIDPEHQFLHDRIAGTRLWLDAPDKHARGRGEHPG